MSDTVESIVEELRQQPLPKVVTRRRGEPPVEVAVEPDAVEATLLDHAANALRRRKLVAEAATKRNKRDQFRVGMRKLRANLAKLRDPAFTMTPGLAKDYIGDVTQNMIWLGEMLQDRGDLERDDQESPT